MSITIYDRSKLKVVQLLDHIDDLEDRAFLLVVSARRWDEERQGYVRDERILCSDERMLYDMSELVQRQVAALYGWGDEEGEEEDDPDDT